MKSQSHWHAQTTAGYEKLFLLRRDTMSTFKMCILLGKWALLFALLLLTPPFGFPSELNPRSVVMAILFILMLLEDFRGTNLLMNPEPLLDGPIELNDSEEVIRKGIGLRQEGIHQKAGRIIVTSQRVVFEPAPDRSDSAPLCIPRSDVASAEQTWSTVFGVIPLFKMGVRINTNSGHSFTLSMQDHKSWLEILND